MIPVYVNFILCRAGDFDCLGASENKSDGFYEKNGYNSSGSSRNSSISSTSSASSGSGWRMTSRTGDLDADADSLTCRQSGLTCNDDRLKMGSKRPRTGMAESFGQVGTVTDAPIQEAYMSGFVSTKTNKLVFQALKMIKLVGIGMLMMMMMTEKLAWISRHFFQSLETLVTSLRTMLYLSGSHRELQSRMCSFFLQILLM
jgi:hypothetical protein